MKLPLAGIDDGQYWVKPRYGRGCEIQHAKSCQPSELILFMPLGRSEAAELWTHHPVGISSCQKPIRPKAQILKEVLEAYASTFAILETQHPEVVVVEISECLVDSLW